MNIGITGASGVIGRALIDYAVRRGHQVIAFSRDPRRVISGSDEVRAYKEDAPPDFAGCHAVVHLAGEPILGIWTQSKRDAVVRTRVDGTRRVVEGIQRLAEPPEVFVCGSAIGFYGEHGDDEITEETGGGDGFLAKTTQAWEHEAESLSGVRTVLLRTSVVLSKRGGAFPMMRTAFGLGLGGRVGSGKQWFSWIHITDQVRLIMWAIENMDIRGPLNATAPWPVRNEELTQTLARLLHRPAFLPVPIWPLRLVLREAATELTGSKRVLPSVATANLFGFQYSYLEPALRELLGLPEADPPTII